MSPIAYVHKLANVIDPTASFLVKKLLLGCQKNKSGDSRCPILPSMLYKLVDHIHCVTSDMYIQVMLRCMFLIAFHCFLRIGEYTMTQCPQHLLRINQFSLVSKGGTCQAFLVIFDSFKHSNGRKVTLRISSSTSQYCPVKSLLRYLSIRGYSPGPLFVFRNKVPVSSSFFYSKFKSIVGLSGYDHTKIKPHSLRIGAATTAASKGYSETQICAMGRWQSTAFKKYVRIPVLNT